MRTLGCFLVVLLTVSAIPAQAADLTIFGGFQHQGSITLVPANAGLPGVISSPRNFGVYGGRVGFGLAGIPFFGQEHTLAIAPSFIDTHSKALIYNSNLMVQAPLILVKPYATMGLGLIHSSANSQQPAGETLISTIGTKFALNYGGGLKFGLFGPLGRRIDVRNYTILNVRGQTMNVVEVSAGAAFSF